MDVATHGQGLIMEAHESGNAEQAAKLTYDHLHSAEVSLINYLKTKRT